MGGMLNGLVGSFAPVSGDFQSIASATGTGSSGTITFSSIPSTYKHLQIRCTTQLSSTDNYAIFRPNNDSSTANYTFHSMYGDGSTTTADGYITGLTGALVSYGTDSGHPTNTTGSGIVDIIDYASTVKYKTIRSFTGYDSNGNGIVFLISSLWKSTAAINSLTVVAQTGNFTTNTIISLYGIKG
jgi:hypothetical protein